MCPNSAATPKRPRRSLLPMMMPPPRPVPSVMQMTSSWPWPAPKRYSPQAAQFASFSTTTGRPMRCSTLSFSGSWRQLMFGAKSTVARLSSTYPAAPMPTASMVWLLLTSDTAAQMASVTPSAVGGVGTLYVSRMVPSSSTTPAAIFVPPMSTPMVSPISPSVSGQTPPRPTVHGAGGGSVEIDPLGRAGIGALVVAPAVAPAVPCGGPPRGGRPVVGPAALVALDRRAVGGEQLGSGRR